MAARAYLRLARVPAAGFTATIGVWGFLAGAHGVGADLVASLSSPAVPLLVSAGILAHIFGCVDNEIRDREIDARAAYRSAKPLAAGTVSLSGAVRLAWAALFAGLAVAAALAWVTSPWVLLLVACSAGLAAAYNRYGKHFLGAEILYPVSLVLFSLAGAAAAGGAPALMTSSVLAVVVLGFLVFFSSSVFAGGLKDLDSDKAGGLPTILGRLHERGIARGSPYGLISLTQGVPSMLILAVAALAIAWVFNRDAATALPRLAVVLALVLVRILLFARAIAAHERRDRVRLLAVHETATVIILPALFADALPAAYGALLILLPLAWFVGSNLAVYGTAAAPDV